MNLDRLVRLAQRLKLVDAELRCLRTFGPCRDMRRLLLLLLIQHRAACILSLEVPNDEFRCAANLVNVENSIDAANRVHCFLPEVKPNF